MLVHPTRDEKIEMNDKAVVPSFYVLGIRC